MPSVDNSLSSRAQTRDELVPSRYALRVGDIDVLVISDGVLPISAGTLAINAAPDDLATWLNRNFLPPDTIDWALNTLVARSGQQTILIDAGLGGQFPGFPRAGQLPHRLEAAGIELAAVTDIVITHMHMDHVGGLLVDGVKERLSPNVRIHVAAAEVDFWTSPDFSRTAMPRPIPEVLRTTAKSFASKYRDNLVMFEDDHEIAPGVVARITGGHTPGHSVVELSSGDERLTFVGDAVFHVGFEHPDWYNGFEHDPEEAARVRVRLFRELAETGGLMVATHLPFPSLGHVAVDADAFRWVPIVWDY